ncbi:MAG: tRNA (adenosine(37)-N6)-dimethylallyltransferase MiaA [Prevotellaceae bacterium]|nr:tRNA (adenosine(37)-N6)-dimethylallyltransferase MiaA [Prevotellaceae bacterium]
MSSKTLLVLLGPTGVGKTELSLLVAEHFGCPIINADSRQIYKDISIGTAAPTAEELARVKHYFVHSLALDEYYSAAEYEKDVLSLLDDLFKQHDTVILSGGSMMYIDAVTKGIDDIPTVDEETREILRHRYETEGLAPLLAELKLLDPEYYDIVDKKNHKRVVHALEICYMTGRSFTSFRTNTKKQRPFNIIKFGLSRNRETLFSRINQRVDQMMSLGFLQEAQKVYPLKHLNSLNTVGYKELFKVIDGEWELHMAVERIKKNTRVYAKKQMTWYKNDTDIQWLGADNMSAYDMLQFIAASKSATTKLLPPT